MKIFFFKLFRKISDFAPKSLKNFILEISLLILNRPVKPNRQLLQGDIVVAGFFGTAIGLGEMARQMKHQFNFLNLSVHAVNVSRLFKQHDEFNMGELWNNEIGKNGIIIFHINPDYFNLISFLIGQKKFIDRRIVGYWNWELDTIPKKWVSTLKHVDEVWVPTHFIAHALLKVSSEKPVHVVPGLLDISSIPTQPSYDLLPQFFGCTLVFFMYDVGSIHARKNPEAVIEAFRRANTPQSVLIIKIKNDSVWPKSLHILQTAIKDMPNVHIIREKFTHEEMKNLIARMDIIISLHRSEGYGLLMLEAMAAAKPVIATGWSGNLDFMTPDCAVLIDYTLVPVEDPQHCYDKYNAVWAEPNIIQAAEALKRLLNNPAERKRLGDAARGHITDYLSPEKWKKSLPKSFWGSLSKTNC